MVVIDSKLIIILFSWIPIYIMYILAGDGARAPNLFTTHFQVTCFWIKAYIFSNDAGYSFCGYFVSIAFSRKNA